MEKVKTYDDTINFLEELVIKLYENEYLVLEKV